MPARWDCTNRDSTREARYLDQWPTPNQHAGIWEVGKGRFLLGGFLLRKLGESDVIHPPGSPFDRFKDVVPWGEDHALVLVRSNQTDAGRGHLFELDVSGPLAVVRQVEFDFTPDGLRLDENGLVVTGNGGVIATSTDAETFVIRRSVLRSDLASISRIPDLEPSYFVAGSAGAMFQGDPWTEAPWVADESATTDRTFGEVFELKGRDAGTTPDDRCLLSRASQRGLFERDFTGNVWRPLELEAPSPSFLCASGAPEACGFPAFPSRTSEPQLDGEDVVVATSDCPRVLVLQRDLGCASTIRPSGDFAEVFDPSGHTAVDGRDLLVVVERGVVAVPLD